MTSKRTNQSSTTESAGAVARRLMRGVTPSQVAAMVAADESGALPALVAAVMAASPDGGDVTEHACLIVAGYWRAGGDASETLRAARAAVRQSRKVVALAATVDAWDMYGDMTDAVGDEAPAHHLPGAWGTAPADGITRTRVGDLTDAAVASLAGAPRASLERAVDDYRAHDEDACDHCHPGAGRRPSLTGITAHVEGWTGADSRYHATRRHTVAGIRAVDPDGVLAAMGGAPLAGMPRPSTARAMVTPRTTEHVTPDAYARDLPAVATTRTAYGRHALAVVQGTAAFTAETRLMRAQGAYLSGGATDENGYPRTMRYGALAYAVDAAREAFRATLPEAVAAMPAPAVATVARDLPAVRIARPDMPAVDIVTVRTADGAVTVRDLSDAEAVAVESAGARTEAARHAGEEYGATSAPYSPATADPFGAVRGKSWVATGEGATPAVSPEARVRSHKPVVSPRKRPGSNTGPMVPARLS